jgi:cyclic-di-AMP phosphodiesterase PgpH
MKTQPFFRYFAKKLVHWQRQYKKICRLYLFCIHAHDKKQYREKASGMAVFSKKKTSFKIITFPKSKERPLDYALGRAQLDSKGVSPLIFIIAVISLTVVIGHDLYNQPQLEVGMLAPQTLIASKSDQVEDKKATEEKQKAIISSSVPVLMLDKKANQEVERNLQQQLNDIKEIRKIAGRFPYLETYILSISTQRYLRSVSDYEWEALKVAVQNNYNPEVKIKIGNGNENSYDVQKNTYPSPSSGWEINKKILSPTFNAIGNMGEISSPLFKDSTSTIKDIPKNQNIEFNIALGELNTQRIAGFSDNISSLILTIDKARKQYLEASNKLLSLQSINPQPVYQETALLNMPDDDWEKAHSTILDVARLILAQGIPSGLPEDILQSCISLHLHPNISTETESLAKTILLGNLKANLKPNWDKTKQLQESKIQPVILIVNKGDILVNKGEKINGRHLVLLEHYQLNIRQVNKQGLFLLGTAVTIAVIFFAYINHRFKYSLRKGDQLLILLLALSTPLVITLGTTYTTWSAIGLLLGNLYGTSLGVTVVGLLGIILPLSMKIAKIPLIAGTVGGILGTILACRLRSREELALLGIAIALTEGGVYLLLNILLGRAFGSGWYVILTESGLLALSGLAWSIIALGLSAYLEKIFDLVPPIRLAELSNPNRPLLKRLATETPGTFQHTLFVATLAEAAAKRMGCNVELVRAGTLYHDIGKMHDPLGFIENQMGGPNKHDTDIKNPWKSAAIIKKHVSEGLFMARKHSLPSAIQAFIPQHQGTMQIAYFYHQAQEIAKDNPSIVVDEADFRYDGPIPQSKETAIVMLADSCEAALRSLKDVSPEKALAMINNILRARWQDNQLLDSGFQREDMTIIAETFVLVWQQFHHKRIAYPKLKSSPEKGTNA